ncbi:MAG: hypothetical protein Q3972_07315, partial [Corynebacterium sp.]|nr:hypothetical protein [Corynebacterium sp.]
MDKEREFQAEDDIETFDAEIVSNDIEPAKAGKICNHPGCTNERDVPELLFCASCRERAQREVEAVDKYLGMVIAGITVGVQAGGLVTLKAARSATNKGIPNLPQLLLALTFLKSQTGHFKAEMESWSGSDQRDLRLSMLHSIRSTSLLAANGLRNAAPTLGAVAKTTTGAVGRTAKNARDTFAEAASNTGSFVVDATRA